MLARVRRVRTASQIPPSDTKAGTGVNEIRVTRHPSKSLDLSSSGKTSSRQPQLRFSDVYTVSSGGALGSGAFSDVRECFHRRTGQAFAVKILQVAAKSVKAHVSGRTITSRDEVLAELKLCSSLASAEGIVRLRESFEEINANTGGGFIYAVFEIMRGGNLSESIAERGSLPEDDARSVMRSLFETCAGLHRRGVVHRDIKLDNILLQHSNDFDKGVKLADMGMAKALGGSSDGKLHEVCGTPLYMAPEMLRLQRRASSAGSVLSEGYGAEVDVWSCGACLYQLLCGFPPFEGQTNVRELFKAITTTEVRCDGDPAWEMVTPEAKDLVRRCLTRDPTERITPDEALQHPWMLDAAPDML